MPLLAQGCDAVAVYPPARPASVTETANPVESTVEREQEFSHVGTQGTEVARHVPVPSQAREDVDARGGQNAGRRSSGSRADTPPA